MPTLNITHDTSELFERPAVHAHVYQAVFKELSQPGYDLNPISFDSYVEMLTTYIMGCLDGCDPEYYFLRYEIKDSEWKYHDGVRLLFGDELAAVLAVIPGIAHHAVAVLDSTDISDLELSKPGQILWQLVDMGREARTEHVCDDCKDAEATSPSTT